MLLKMKCLNFEAFPGTQHACTSSRQHLRVSASVQPESSQRVELREKRKQNVPGPFWVDSSCINCDTCRWIEPSVFHADGGQSAVHHQPSEGSEEEAAALRAVTACPTGSIHFSNEEMTRVQASAKVREGAVSFPYLFPKARELGLEIYHLGYHSRDSFAATPWLVRNAETDLAVMVDTPRYSSKLKRAILDRVGEVKYIFLTHSHDVADHNKWAQELGAKRVIHECEADPSLAMTKEAGLGLDECEIKLQGEGPWDPFEGALGAGTKLLWQPGHTPGGVVMHFQPEVHGPAVAFTGDHLAFVPALGRLGTFQFINFQPPEVQAEALRRWADDTAAADVCLVLPGHGRWYSTDDFAGELRDVAGQVERGEQELNRPW